MIQEYKIIEHLNYLGKGIEEKFPTINLGGCCVFASIVVEQLLKIGIKATGIATARMMNYTGEVIDNVRGNIKDPSDPDEWEYNGIVFDHVAVEFQVEGKYYHYDTSGVKPANKIFCNMYVYTGRLNLYELQEMAGAERGWNKDFSRSQIGAVGRKIRKAFQQIMV